MAVLANIGKILALSIPSKRNPRSKTRARYCLLIRARAHARPRAHARGSVNMPILNAYNVTPRLKPVIINANTLPISWQYANTYRKSVYFPLFPAYNKNNLSRIGF